MRRRYCWRDAQLKMWTERYARRLPAVVLQDLTLLGSHLRAIALDRLGIRRVGAHVDALLPGAREGITDAELHAADPVDLEVDNLAVLQRTQALVVGAAGDHVARVEGHDRRGELDRSGTRCSMSSVL